MISPDFLIEQYRSAGFQRLGGGLYSSVYAKPDADWCIKVSHTNDGCLAYYQFAIQNGWIGTHAPYIYSIKAVNGLYVTIMERLATCVGDLPYNSIERRKAHETMRSTEWRRRLYMIEDHVHSTKTRYHSDDIRCDTHEWNWMLRHNDDLVLTDPIAGETKSPVITHWRNPKPRLPLAA